MGIKDKFLKPKMLASNPLKEMRLKNGLNLNTQLYDVGRYIKV